MILGCRCGMSAVDTDSDGGKEGDWFCIYCGDKLVDKK
jgi:hypothetical protein